MPDQPDSQGFLDPGKLSDGRIELVLARKQRPDVVRGWCRAYYFEIRHAVTGAALGQVSFRAGHSHALDYYSGHIGYGIHEPARGHHFAEKAVRLLFPFIRRHGFSVIWITCNPDNLPSRRTCERLGAEFVEVVPVPEDNDMFLRGETHKCRYRLTLGESVAPDSLGQQARSER